MSWPNDDRVFHQRVLDATRRVRLGDAVRVGDALKVVGTATIDGGWLRAPLSGSDRCVCWSARVDEGLAFAGVVIEDARSTRFWVVDGGIRARVHPPVGFGLTAQETRRGSDEPEPALWLAEAFLRQHGELPWAGALKVRRDLTYRERRIDEGDVVAVVGRVREVQTLTAPGEGDRGGGYRERPAAVDVALTLELDVGFEGAVIVGLVR